MMKRQTLILSTLLIALFSGAAVAGPENGFGLNAGLTNYKMTPQNNTATYNSAGLSLGMDYQFALSRQLSLSPFLMTSGEASSVNNVSIGHGIVGLQLRYWAGNVFFGGHIGNYSEVQTLTVGSVTVSASGSGGGAGLVAGWENPNGGFFAMGQVDSANISYSTGDTKLAGIRLSMGYRWK